MRLLYRKVVAPKSINEVLEVLKSHSTAGCRNSFCEDLFSFRILSIHHHTLFCVKVSGALTPVPQGTEITLYVHPGIEAYMGVAFMLLCMYQMFYNLVSDYGNLHFSVVTIAIGAFILTAYVSKVSLRLGILVRKLMAHDTGDGTV